MNSLHNLLIPISRQITWRQFSCCGWHGTQQTTKLCRQPQLSLSNYSHSNNSIWVYARVYGCKNADLCLSLIINGEEGLQRRRLIYRKKKPRQMMKASTGERNRPPFLCSNNFNFFPGFTMQQHGNTFIETHQWTHWKGCLLIRPKLYKLLKGSVRLSASAWFEQATLMLLLNQQHSSKTIISSFSYPICQRKVFHAKKAEKNNFLSSSQTARESCADETELERRFMFCLVYAVANSHTNLCYLHEASFEFDAVQKEFLQGKLESQAQHTFVS